MIASAVDTSKTGFFDLARRRSTEDRPQSLEMAPIRLGSLRDGDWSRQMERHRFEHTRPLEIRPCEEALRLRKEAQGTHPSIERERLLRRARQAEMAAQMTDWLRSTGAQTPK